jgi:hypothetical protein
MYTQLERIMLKKTIGAVIIMLAALYQQIAMAQDYSANLGYNSEYITFTDDFDGTFYEAGYGNNLTVSDTDLFDYGVALIYSDSTLLGGESDTNINFTLSKTFSF